ncbi:hypothetical protein L6R50_21150 [Myxococcota bacterium]|nr:hypothetical protein [Myxococcota bacterium]
MIAQSGAVRVLACLATLGLGACPAGDGADDDAADDDAADDDAADDDAADDDATPPGTAPVLSDFTVGAEGAPAGQLRAYFAYVDAEGDVSQGMARIWGDGGSTFPFPIEFPDQENGAFVFDLPVDNPGWQYEPGTSYLWHATLEDRAGNESDEVTFTASTP